MTDDIFDLKNSSFLRGENRVLRVSYGPFFLEGEASVEVLRLD